MWFKKKSVLLAEHHYDTEKSADGSTDLRTTYKDYINNNSSINNSGLPSAADAGNYFYLPALGFYRFGKLNFVGSIGYFWASSTHPWGRSNAYHLTVYSSAVTVYYNSRDHGFRVDGFE